MHDDRDESSGFFSLSMRTQSCVPFFILLFPFGCNLKIVSLLSEHEKFVLLCVHITYEPLDE